MRFKNGIYKYQHRSNNFRGYIFSSPRVGMCGIEDACAGRSQADLAAVVQGTQGANIDPECPICPPKRSFDLGQPNVRFAPKAVIHVVRIA